MFIKSKFTKWYFSIISNAKSRQLLKNTYYERHHITPKSLGGTNAKDNLVNLTGREHFICHKLLTKMVSGQPKYKMIESLAIFSNNTNRHLKLNSRDISKIRESNALASSFRNKGNQYYKLRAPDSIETRRKKSVKAKNSKWMNNGEIEIFTTIPEVMTCEGFRFGRLPFSLEWQRSLSKNRKGRVDSEITREKKRLIHLGKPKSAKHIENMKLAKKTMRKYSCEHCGLVTNKLNHTRWHGPNCKSLTTH